MHTAVISPSSLTLSGGDLTPGTTKQLSITVQNATQPVETISGTVSVEFAGDTVTAPLSITLNNTAQPTTTFDLGGSSSVTVATGTPNQTGPAAWVIPVTLTVV